MIPNNAQSIILPFNNPFDLGNHDPAIAGTGTYKQAAHMMSHFHCYEMPSKEHLSLFLAAKKILSNQELRSKLYAS